MGEKINKKFNNRGQNFLHPDDMFNYTKLCVHDFAEGYIWDDLLIDLGQHYNYGAFLEQTDHSEPIRISHTELALRKNLISISEGVFHLKVEEQKTLQNLTTLIYQIDAHTPDQEQWIANTLTTIGKRLGDNETLLHSILDDNVDHFELESSLTLAMRDYKQYTPKKVNIDPRKQEIIIPFFDRECKRLNQLSFKDRDVRCFYAMRMIAFYHAFALKGEYPDFGFRPDLHNIPQNQRHELISNGLSNVIADIQKDHKNIDMINESVVLLLQRRFERHAISIKMPTSRDLKL